MEQHKHMLQAYPPLSRKTFWKQTLGGMDASILQRFSLASEAFREIPAAKEFKSTNESIQAACRKLRWPVSSPAAVQGAV